MANARSRSGALLDCTRAQRNNLGARRSVERYSVAMLAALFRIEFPLAPGGGMAPPPMIRAPEAMVGGTGRFAFADCLANRLVAFSGPMTESYPG